MIKRAKQPAGQMPRHDCHGVHPNQTHEEWLSSMKEKQSNVSNILDHGAPDFKGLLGDFGIGGVAGGAATLPATARDALKLRGLAKHAPEDFAFASDMAKTLSGKSLRNLKLMQYLRSGGKGALVGGGIAGLLGLLLGNTKRSSVTDWAKRKAFDFAPQHFGGQRGGQFGAQFGSLFGMDAQGKDLGQQAGRFGGRLYKNLSKGNQDLAYNTMNRAQPIMQQGFNFINQLGGGMNKQTNDKQAGLLNLLAAGAGAGGVLGGGYGAYKAPEGERPEGFGRGAYRGAAAGLGAGTGAVGGGIGGGILGQVLSNAIAGRPQNLGERRHLPTILALLGAGLGGYGGGKLGWGMTGGDAQPEEEKEAGHIQLNFKSASFSDDINKVRSMEKKSDLAVLMAIINALRSRPGGGNNAGPGGRGWEGAGRGFARGLGTELGAGIGAGAGILATKHPVGALAGLLGGYLGNRTAGGLLGPASYSKQIVEKASSDKQANLARVLGGIGSALGHGIGGGAKGWANLVGKGLKAKGFIPKATAVTGGGLSLSALNEMLAATRGGPIELPHIGMGSDHPMWDPMMHHDRIDPKKTGYKSLLHMATRPLQTAAVWTGMAKKPGSLADYARAQNQGDNRLSDILNDPTNFRIDPNTGQGTATGEVPFTLDSTFQEQISDFNRQRERLEAMGILPRRSGPSSGSRHRPHTRPFRGRYD